MLGKIELVIIMFYGKVRFSNLIFRQQNPRLLRVYILSNKTHFMTFIIAYKAL